MMNHFKNKFFYIVTVVALVLTIFPTVFYAMGVSFPVRNLLNAALIPVQKLFDYASDAIDGYASYFYRFDELVEENIALREQVEMLENERYDTEQLEKMYAWLAQFLDVKMRHDDFDFLAASVTGKDGGNYSRTITIDVGTQAGVQVNMPVICEYGAVGYVTEVGLNWAKVMTVVSQNSSIGAYIERTGDAGIAKGNFDLAEEGLFMLSYLPDNAEVRVGDRVLSSGFGSVYPRGLMIGYIEKIEDNPYTRTVDITVKSRVDFTQIQRVMVITDHDVTAVDPYPDEDEPNDQTPPLEIESAEGYDG